MMNKVELLQHIGSVIHKYRIRANLNTDQLSAMLGLSRPSIVNIELGKNGTGIDTLYTAIRLLNIPISEIFPTLPPIKYKVSTEEVVIEKVVKVKKVTICDEEGGEDETA